MADDLFDELRSLVEMHPDHHVTQQILFEIWRLADDCQDGAEDAGPVPIACTRIAALAKQELGG